MFILYSSNESGSLDVQLVAMVHEALWSVIRGQAARAMRISGADEGVGDLEHGPFKMWSATNRFGDEFAVLHALVPPKTYKERAESVDRYQSKTRYERIARALNDVNNPVRFIGIDVVPEPQTNSRMSLETQNPPETNISHDGAKAKPWLPEEWAIVRQLGQGGQGWAYLVRRSDQSDPIPYVFKRLKNKDRASRFIAEIRALQALSHPGILRILDSGESRGHLFYISEYCENGDLSRYSLSGHTLRQRLLLYREICDAVAAAHSALIIHRDLKPSNVLIRGNGNAVVGDFGLCLHLADEKRFTSSSEAVGARDYIAPELEDGRLDNPTASADVYSLGKLLYYLICGRSFSREKHRAPAYDLLHPETGTADPYLYFVYDLLDKTIATNPSERYQSATQLREALDGVIMKIEGNAHVLDMNVPQNCLYCVTGLYRPHMGSGDQFRITLVCSRCGNTQHFAAENTGAPSWWRK